jgi:hypothetical protein
MGLSKSIVLLATECVPAISSSALLIYHIQLITLYLKQKKSYLRWLLDVETTTVAILLLFQVFLVHKNGLLLLLQMEDRSQKRDQEQLLNNGHRQLLRAMVRFLNMQQPPGRYVELPRTFRAEGECEICIKYKFALRTPKTVSDVKSKINQCTIIIQKIKSINCFSI